MEFKAAVILEQGVTFALVLVHKHIADNQAEAAKVQQIFSALFPGIPAVLMGKDPIGRTTYFGREDICRFMATVPESAVPWQIYEFSGFGPARLSARTGNTNHPEPSRSPKTQTETIS